LYTPLAELWYIFQTILVISPTTEIGFTMMGADVFLKGYDFVLGQVTHREFWRVMVYFLNRTNEKFRERRKSKLAQLGRRK